MTVEVFRLGESLIALCTGYSLYIPFSFLSHGVELVVEFSRGFGQMDYRERLNMRGPPDVSGLVCQASHYDCLFVWQTTNEDDDYACNIISWIVFIELHVLREIEWLTRNRVDSGFGDK